MHLKKMTEVFAGWNHSEKMELTVYLLGASHYSEKKHSIEAVLIYNIKF